MPEIADHYTLLDIPRDASPEDIRQAYFAAARRWHPDKVKSKQNSEKFLEIQKAYEVLNNPKKRAEYDVTLPPAEIESKLIRYKTLYSRQGLPRMKEQQLVYVLIEFFATKDKESRPSPPLNLCLVLDRSTSMQGQNMDMVKATAIELLRRLRASDTLAVVAFSDRAETIIPAAHNIEQKKFEARIQMLQTSGGTEIFQGLEKGYEEIRRGHKKPHINHIILITDGRTYGDEKKCLELAGKAAETGIGISGLGIGNEWNDDFLDKLASLTGGSSFFVTKPQDIQHILLEKFNKLWQVHARESTLEFNVSEGVDLRYAFRLQPEVGLLPIESPLHLGPVLKDINLKILMEFAIHPTNSRTENVRLLNGAFKVSTTTKSTPVQSTAVRLSRPVTGLAEPQAPPQEILKALSYLSLYRLQELARQEVAAGKYTEASRRLQRLATHLLEQGQRGLARTALVEAEHIQRQRKFTNTGEKLIKYGTRSLLMPEAEAG
jgi:Ca-activated chloride channel family protein